RVRKQLICLSTCIGEEPATFGLLHPPCLHAVDSRKTDDLVETSTTRLVHAGFVRGEAYHLFESPDCILGRNAFRCLFKDFKKSSQQLAGSLLANVCHVDSLVEPSSVSYLR